MRSADSVKSCTHMASSSEHQVKTHIVPWRNWVPLTTMQTVVLVLQAVEPSLQLHGLLLGNLFQTKRLWRGVVCHGECHLHMLKEYN